MIRCFLLLVPISRSADNPQIPMSAKTIQTQLQDDIFYERRKNAV